MVRVPRSWPPLAGLAGANYAAGARVRTIPRPPDHLYVNQVNVDLGNDGVAPQVTFKADGTAQALAGPSGGGDSWSLDQCFVSTSVGQLDAATCVVYVGPLPLAQYAVTGSLLGGGSQFGLGGLTLAFGWFVYALWTGGTPGAFGLLRVTGTKTVLTA